ncbi:ATP-dependent RNA helicase DEAH12-like protein [Cladobotryum mycophilum]|uniref:RBR-type E3 ubiquitin transferase n=1 Tax=Cladobotryum mycophilum TaxID=491253 RepID=A0ABR0SH35_9HYPO
MSYAMFNGDVDQASLDLILKLQLQDVQSLLKGKNRAGETPRDLELAMEMYRSDLRSVSSFMSDRAMCQSIARAVMQDEAAIVEHNQLEAQAARDRRQALGQPSTGLQGSSRTAAGVDAEEEVINRLRSLYMDDDSSSAISGVGESSSWASTRKHHPSTVKVSSIKVTRRNCVACGDDFRSTEIINCPCSHEYCRGCILELFRASMLDESLFPPRCCTQPIPMEANLAFFSATLVGEFRAKEIEYGTPNRTYCHQPRCSAFVPPQFIRGGVARCVKCRASTCTTCKGAAHNEDCPDDPATQELLRVAGENGWQRCQSCRRMVELDTGCNHITCRCGAEFCYVCGVKWKRCTCPQWHEHRLIERAENVVNRDARRGQFNPNQFAQLVDPAGLSASSVTMFYQITYTSAPGVALWLVGGADSTDFDPKPGRRSAAWHGALSR